MQNRVRSFGHDLTSAAGAQKKIKKWRGLSLKVAESLIAPSSGATIQSVWWRKTCKIVVLAVLSLNISHLTITAEASWRIYGLEPPLVSPPTWYLTVKTFLKYRRTFFSIFHLRLKFWTFWVALSWQDNLLPPVRQLLILENKSNSERELKSLLT